MEKIRTNITNDNLEFTKNNNLSVTKLINNLITYMRIEVAHKGDDNELQKNLQRIIHDSRKSQ